LYLAQSGEKGNDAFLGIGVIEWVIIVVVVALAVYLFMRSRRRSLLDRLRGRRREGSRRVAPAPSPGRRGKGAIAYR
jgi:hypothetical protein